MLERGYFKNCFRLVANPAIARARMVGQYAGEVWAETSRLKLRHDIRITLALPSGERLQLGARDARAFLRVGYSIPQLRFAAREANTLADLGGVRRGTDLDLEKLLRGEYSPGEVYVGTYNGDEGKGLRTRRAVQRAVQNAAPGEKVRVARWQAGGNCDQSIREDGHTFELTQIPAGALDPGTVNVIGDACVVNPTTVFEEIDLMRSRGVFPELLVSERAHLVFPFHQTIRAAEDAFRYGQKKWGGGIGIGVGPAQADKWGRAGIPIRLFRPENRAILEEKLKEQIMRYNALLEAYGVELRYSYDEVLAQFDAAYARMKQEGWLIPSASQHLETALREGETVIFQGTQAGMVDMDHGGDYPQVTSSNTIAGAVYGATGIAPAWIRSRYGIVKAYGTRNHEGIMVPELKDEVATDEAALSHLREKGREYFYDWAKWEKQGLGGEPPMNFGRPKRAAWLDAVANGYMARKSGITGFIVTKLDVFSGLPEIRICVGYRVGDQVITAGTFDGSAEISRIAEPVYETLPGWTEDISGVTDFALLPSAAQRFLVRVGELLSVPVVRFATGPKAENEGVVPQALFAGLTGFYQTGVAS